MGLRRGKTEHDGPRDMSRKHGHWGATEEAKKWASRARRRDERAEIATESLSRDEEDSQDRSCRPAVDQGSHGLFTCPACGSAELTEKPYATWPPPVGQDLRPPYEDALGLPSYEVCPSCGFEFGNDDNPGTAPPATFAEYRAEWEADGSPRFESR